MKKRIARLAVICAVVSGAVMGCGVFFPAASPGAGKTGGIAVEVRCGVPGAGSGRGLIDDGNVLTVSVEAKDSGGNVVGTSDLDKGKSYWVGHINIASSGLVSFHATAKGLEDAVLYTGWSTVTISEMNRTVIIAMTALNGLAGEWLFNGDAADTSGNGADGNIVGATPATDRFGNQNAAYSFNGAGDYIQAAADSLPTAARTVSLWFYANDISTRPYVMGYGGGAIGQSWIQHINHQLIPNAYAVHCHGFNGLLSAAYSVAPENRWVHWVITTDPSGTKMYVDNVLVAENSTYINTTVVTGKSLLFGALVTTDGTGPYTDENGSWFDGRLDDIRIYNRALTAAQVSDLYHEGGWPLPGSLDASFGSAGKVTTAFGSGGDDEVYAAALQSDGKIVVSGESWNLSDYDFALARYNTDGASIPASVRMGSSRPPSEAAMIMPTPSPFNPTGRSWLPDTPITAATTISPWRATTRMGASTPVLATAGSS